MFLKLHGMIDNNRLLINVDFVEAIQEIKEGSKYYEYHTKMGAKTVISMEKGIIVAKESITQIENMLKRGDS